MRVVDPVCNHLVNPLGVETPAPVFSWKITSDRRSVMQGAYRILAATSPECLREGSANAWDSGVVTSGRSVHVTYGGRPLGSRERIWWTVRVWDTDGTASEWSEPAFFEMGLLQEADWSARWIGATGYTDPKWGWIPAAHLRRDFSCEKAVAHARLYACGLGYHDLWLNGERVTDEVLGPAVSKYDKRVYYQTFDVTRLLKQGANAAGVLLGDGWFNHQPKDCWMFFAAPWRNTPRLRYQLEITYADGSCGRVVSDGLWQACSDGPILTNGLRCGEVYDARKELPGWTAPQYDASSWKPARVVTGPGGELHSQQMTPMRVVREKQFVSAKEVKPGVWILDFGENLTGWGRLRVKVPSGTEISLRYAERLDEDGDLYQDNINTLVKECDFQRDVYTAAGTGVEEWHARFTYHGFQYVQVTGLPSAPDGETLVALVLHTDFATRGSFECSHDLLNKIQELTRRSTLGNYHGIPTDCPHREKNGWTGDAQLSAEQCLLNFDPMSAYTKWMQDFRDEQRPNGDIPAIVPAGSWGFTWGNGLAWDSAAFIMPWTQYLYCGDERILTDQYGCMTRYLDHIATVAEDGIVDHGLGDWCPPKGEKDGGVICPAIVTSTAYYYVDARIAEATARLLGKSEDAERHGALAQCIRTAFRKRFLDPQTFEMPKDTQTAYACALYQGMVDDHERDAVLARLVDTVRSHDMHIDAGILGSKYVMHALTDGGRADVAFAIATQTTFPGWGYWIAQGATTLWEDWGGGGSRNHHMFGDISAWFYKGLAGINPDPAQPGFRHTFIRPNPVDGLDWVKAWHDSPYGRIGVRWKRDGSHLTLEIDIPANTTATVELPTRNAAGVMLDGKPLSPNCAIPEHGPGAGRVACRVGSGQYVFTCPLS